MNIVVFMKQTVDSATRIKIKDSEKNIDDEGVQYVVNPYDEFAIEESLRIKEKFGGEITVISLGTDRVKTALLTCLAMGVDKAVHINDSNFEGVDNFIISKALSASLKNIPYDLILCGKQAIDDDCAQVGQMIAENSGIPHVSAVIKMDITEDQKSATVDREIEGGFETVETRLPALITCQKGLNEPRIPSLKGIMASKKKEIALITAEVLGLKPDETGNEASKIVITSLSLPPERKAGQMIDEGEPAATVKKLVSLLREDAKVI